MIGATGRSTRGNDGARVAGAAPATRHAAASAPSAWCAARLVTGASARGACRSRVRARRALRAQLRAQPLEVIGRVDVGTSLQ